MGVKVPLSLRREDIKEMSRSETVKARDRDKLRYLARRNLGVRKIKWAERLPIRGLRLLSIRTLLAPKWL